MKEPTCKFYNLGKILNAMKLHRRCTEIACLSEKQKHITEIAWMMTLWKCPQTQYLRGYQNLFWLVAVIVDCQLNPCYMVPGIIWLQKENCPPASTLWRSSNFIPALPTCLCVLIARLRLFSKVWFQLSLFLCLVAIRQCLMSSVDAKGCFRYAVSFLSWRNIVKRHSLNLILLFSFMSVKWCRFWKRSSIMGSRILNPLCCNLHCPAAWLASSIARGQDCNDSF